jgi:hypothetical protein
LVAILHGAMSDRHVLHILLLVLNVNTTTNTSTLAVAITIVLGVVLFKIYYFYTARQPAVMIMI